MYSAKKLKYSISTMIKRMRSAPRRDEVKRERLSFAPYQISIYQNLLKGLSSEEKYVVCNLENFSKKRRQDKVNILLRHDIDTSDCIRKMSLLLEEDLNYHFIPSVYLRVDGEAYSLHDWKALIEEYSQKGVPFGLHSTCYVYQNYIETFKEETKKFIDETGMIPKSFTLHGLGEQGIKNRMEFISKVKKIAKMNGYLMTDCSNDYISYDFVMHDSHWNGLNQKRYILDEFANIPLFPKGKHYLILTHPCYWAN